MKNIFKYLFALIAVVLLSIPTSVLANSEVNDIEYKHKQPTKEQKEIEQIIIQADLEAHKEAYNELESKNAQSIMVMNKQNIEDTNQFKQLVQEKIDEKISKYDIKRVSEPEVVSEPEMGTFSVSPPSTELTINAPSVYSSSQGYVVKASVAWKKDNSKTPYWYYHRPLFGSSVGGADGLGIYFTRPNNLDISSSSFYTYDNFDRSYNTNLYPSKSQPEGVYYKAQDTYSTLLEQPYYTWDRSYITIWPSFHGSVDTKAFTHFTHTWSSANISNVSVSNTGFNVSISDSSKSYDGTSTTGVSIVVK